MEKYTIVFAPSAETELDETVVWLTGNAPEKVVEWVQALRAEVGTLRMHPERCPLAPENGLWGEEELRQLLFREYPSVYRIIFTVHKKTVRILSVRHGARRFLHEE